MPDAPAPKAAAKKSPQYVVYHKDDQGILTPIGTINAPNPREAIKQFAEHREPAAAPTVYVAFAASAVTEVTVRTETKTEVIFDA